MAFWEELIYRFPVKRENQGTPDKANDESVQIWGPKYARDPMKVSILTPGTPTQRSDQPGSKNESPKCHMALWEELIFTFPVKRGNQGTPDEAKDESVQLWGPKYARDPMKVSIITPGTPTQRSDQPGKQK